MKKVFAVIAALVLAVPSFAQYSSGGFDLDKENLYYGVRIGMTGATLSGDAVEVKDLGSKVGLPSVVPRRTSSASATTILRSPCS